MKEKVVLGLSGGVDSAVAATLLKKDGYEVIGLFLNFGLTPPDDAKKLANDMGIEFHTLELADELEKYVCSNFRQEYVKGRTPNPCIVCNPNVKFKALIEFADEIGAKYIATGHYAQIRHEENQSYLVQSDSPKDQTYMLYRLPQAYVSRIIFPLADYKTKDEVRQEAEKSELFVKSKPDSMEVCFIPDNNHAGYIEKFGVCPPEGNFIDENGKVLGKHRGIHHYTVGQRKGLEVSATGRLYVHSINVKDNTITLSLNDVFADKITVSDTSFILEEYAKMESFKANVKVRYSKRQSLATIYPSGKNATIIFDEPVRAPASGQSAVFYNDNYVIGGGFID